MEGQEMKTAIVLSALLMASVAFGSPTLDKEAATWEIGPLDQDFSHPGELIYEDTCFIYTEEWDPNYEQYHYYQVLEPPFEQVPGNIYWISIQAYLLYPPQWGWCETETPWMDEGVIRSEYFGIPDWTPLSVVLGYPVDFAFVLWGADGAIKYAQYPLPGANAISSQYEGIVGGLDTECADDFPCNSPFAITAIEWWGSYWNPGEPPFADFFIIRFYTNVPISPVEETSWGSIKALFK
jgi:hypothetical protein